MKEQDRRFIQNFIINIVFLMIGEGISRIINKNIESYEKNN